MFQNVSIDRSGTRKRSSCSLCKRTGFLWVCNCREMWSRGERLVRLKGSVPVSGCVCIQKELWAPQSSLNAFSRTKKLLVLSKNPCCYLESLKWWEGWEKQWKGKQWPEACKKENEEPSCKIEAAYLHTSLHLQAVQQMCTKVMALLWGKPKRIIALCTLSTELAIGMNVQH